MGTVPVAPPAQSGMHSTNGRGANREKEPTFPGLRRAVWKRRGMAALSALLLALAFPPFGWWWTAWFALAPWYAQLSAPRTASTLPPRFGAGFWFGFPLFLVGMFWLNEIGGVPWFALAVVQGTFFAVWAAITIRVLPRLPAWMRPLVFASLWTLFEAARSIGRVAFPWFLLSTTQVRALPLLQIVSVTAQWGLSFAIACACGFLVEAIRASGKTRVRFAATFVAIPAVLGMWGAFTMQTQTGDKEPVLLALCQGDEHDWYQILPTYDRLTREAVLTPSPQGRPALVVWPEGTLPGDLSENKTLRDVVHSEIAVRNAGYNPDQKLSDWVSDLARFARTPLIVGDDEKDNASKWWRMGHLYDAQGNHVATYRKRQLVPFGEFFPLRDFLGPVFARYGGDFEDFNPGTEAGVFTFTQTNPQLTPHPIKTGLLICYEDAFPYVAREAVEKGAEMLTFITSDQSFGTSAGPYQHLDMAQVRAVETRRYIARCTTTGVSTLITPAGQIEKRLGLGERGVLFVSPRLRDDQSVYVRFGDWWLWVCGLLALGGATYPLTLRRKANHLP